MAADALRHRTFTSDEIRHHTNPDDLWMVISGKVYDVTAFAPHHPGGVEVLLDCGGVDATGAFDDVAHSQDAKDMLRPYLIGYMDTYIPAPGEDGPVEQQPRRKGRRLSPKRRKKNGSGAADSVVLVLLVAACLCCGVLLQLQKLQWVKLTAS